MSDSESTKADPNQTLSRHDHPAQTTVENARHLLDYTARHGIDVPVKSIAAVLKADLRLIIKAFMNGTVPGLRLYRESICRLSTILTVPWISPPELKWMLQALN